MSHYHITGTIDGRRYQYSTSDFEYALKKFEANKLKSLWSVDNNGKKELIKKKEGQK